MIHPPLTLHRARLLMVYWLAYDLVSSVPVFNSYSEPVEPSFGPELLEPDCVEMLSYLSELVGDVTLFTYLLHNFPTLVATHKFLDMHGSLCFGRHTFGGCFGA
jgi:hypothetical protein